MNDLNQVARIDILCLTAHVSSLFSKYDIALLSCEWYDWSGG